ncbi:MAG: LuxR C-terminal-related transcriptional regulator [Muribaculaceae bacterium]
MSSITIAIISRNTISAIGIKYLLQDLFSIQATIFQSLTDMDASGQDNYDLYITSSEEYVDNIDYFIPRRNKSLIIASKSTKSGILNYNSDENTIIEQLKATIKQVEQSSTSTHNELSQREIDVLKLIATGMLNKEIADSLNISINTVLTHRKNITSKLGIRSVSGLSFYAMMNGYVNSI